MGYPGPAYDEYGRAYLQKLVQVQFDLPPATPDQLLTMLRIGRATGTGPAGAGDNGHPVSEVAATHGPVQAEESVAEAGTGSLAAEPAGLAGDDQRADAPGISVARPSDAASVLAADPARPRPNLAAAGAAQPPEPSPGKHDDLVSSVMFTVLCFPATVFLIVSFLNTGRAGTRLLYAGMQVLIFSCSSDQ